MPAIFPANIRLEMTSQMQAIFPANICLEMTSQMQAIFPAKIRLEMTSQMQAILILNKSHGEYIRCELQLFSISNKFRSKIRCEAKMSML